jgi:hypothetical protein
MPLVHKGDQPRNNRRGAPAIEPERRLFKTQVILRSARVQIMGEAGYDLSQFSFGPYQFTCRVRPAQYGFRSSRFRILPDGFRGNDSTKSTDFGAL